MEMTHDAKHDLEPDAIHEQLVRVLVSGDFDASDRNRRFLKYVIDETLQGRADRVKAYNIATSVFGRDASFDPQVDSIVRIEAGRLRRSLERYYLTAGARDPVRIAIPRGSYVPEFEATAPAAPGHEEGRQAPALRQRRPLRNGRAIMVMPFDEDGDPSAFPHFTRGFIRQLIVGLTRFTDLLVFAHPAGLHLEDTAAPLPGVAHCGMAYLLTGGTTVSAGRFSVEALLIDARTGQHLWAESFERALHPQDAVTLRDEVANGIARTLAQPYGIIFSHIAKHVGASPADELRSPDRVVQFYQYLRSCDRALFEPVRLGLERAIVDDPDYADAFACLSRMYSNTVRLRHDVRGSAGSALQRALALARRAIELAPRASRGHHALGLALWFTGDVNGAIAAFETSRAHNPNDTDVMADLGLRYALRAEWDKAVPLLEGAFALNPAESSVYRIGLFLCHHLHGRTREALAEARRIDAPHVVHGFVAMAMAAAQGGLEAEAQAAVQAIRTICPGYGDDLATDLGARNLHPDVIGAIVEGLRQAGLPERDAGSDGGKKCALWAV